jgi:prepilin-type processing-associated H-X9-DG protein
MVTSSIYFAPTPAEPDKGRFGSWLMYLLPYVEQDNVFRQLDFTTNFYSNVQTANSPGATYIPAYICPADYVPNKVAPYGSYYFGVNSYFGNAGTIAGSLSSSRYQPPTFNGVLCYNSSIKLTSITDGTSNTLLAGERYSRDPDMDNSGQSNYLPDWRGWAWTEINSSGDSLCDTSAAINTPKAQHVFGEEGRRRTFGSGHGNGANFVLCDGSVRWLQQDIQYATFVHLAIPNDGNVVQFD